MVADIDDGGLRFLKEKAPDDELRMVILVFGRNQNVHDSTTAAPHDLEICLVDLDLHGDTCESNVACFAGPRGTGLERDSSRHNGQSSSRVDESAVLEGAAATMNDDPLDDFLHLYKMCVTYRNVNEQENRCHYRDGAASPSSPRATRSGGSWRTARDSEPRTWRGRAGAAERSREARVFGAPVMAAKIRGARR